MELCRHISAGSYVIPNTHIIHFKWKSAYFYADKYPEGDLQNYLEYALLSASFLAEHHDAEESALFPALEKKIPGSMEHNEAQHQSFLKPLEELIEYINLAKAEGKLDSATYRAKVDSILVPVMQHLAEELDSLEGSKLLEHFSESELDTINKATHKAQQGDNHKMLPFVLQVQPSSWFTIPARTWVRQDFAWSVGVLLEI
ncbi:hypothetical protein HHX47_DHR2000073 [Lentinula edodes]|nr:hypothetical protein HHX47_DHR2000073 [Lentinula edodes]